MKTFLLTIGVFVLAIFACDDNTRVTDPEPDDITVTANFQGVICPYSFNSQYGDFLYDATLRVMDTDSNVVLTTRQDLSEVTFHVPPGEYLFEVESHHSPRRLVARETLTSDTAFWQIVSILWDEVEFRIAIYNQFYPDTLTVEEEHRYLESLEAQLDDFHIDLSSRCVETSSYGDLSLVYYDTDFENRYMGALVDTINAITRAWKESDNVDIYADPGLGICLGSSAVDMARSVWQSGQWPAQPMTDVGK